MRTVRLVGVVVAVVLAVTTCSGEQAPERSTDWDFFGQVVHVEWTGDYVVQPPDRVLLGLLGEMDVTLADGQVLHFQAGGKRTAWCKPIDPDVWVQDYENCWVAGSLDESRQVVYSWRTMKPGPARAFLLGGVEAIVDGEVVVHGYRFPISESVWLRLKCCPEDVQTLEDTIGEGYALFNVDTGEVVRIECGCGIP
jgi:hypothetical protein